MTKAQLVEDFYSKDPLRGDDAYRELVRQQGSRAIESLIPLGGGGGASSLQVVARLKSVATALGPGIVPYLVRVIEQGAWSTKLAASPCFAGFEDSPDIEAPLLRVLEKGRDVDAERVAIEALGYLGADGWAWDLVQYAKHGDWRPGARQDWDFISEYSFEKLSSFALEAISRFAGLARSRERVDSLFRLLSDFIELRQQRLPYMFPDSYAHVFARDAKHTLDFTGWIVDPIISLWGRSPNERLRQLCLDTLGKVAPLRAAHFLLDTALDQEAPASIRRDASVALGELRHPHAAQLLADTLRDPAVDRTFLDWAFSTLYAVPADWSGLDEYVDRLLNERGDPSAQLLWALALRGDDRIEERLLARLGGREPFERWTAALALARLLGPKSRPHLEQRGDDAGNVLEQCGMFAAALRAGDASMAPRLHEALQAADSLPLLRTIWKVELLDAFRATDGFDERAFPLWRTAAGVTPRQLQYFSALVSPALPPVAPVVVPTSAPRQKLFISYSHRDGAWLSRFQVMLRPLLDAEQLEVWDDTKIVPGKWRAQIDRAMADSHVALFLVSAHFLASEFITRHELPSLLKHVEEQGIHVVWVLLDDCLWEVSALADYQGENATQPLTLLSEGEQSRAIKKACVRIQGLLPRSA